jgi:outer membrane protein assembly factor BamB
MENKKMQTKKILAIMTLFLMITTTIPLFTSNFARAEITMKSYPFIGAMPNPIGVGQETLFHLGISAQTAWPQPGWEGITVTVTKPDGTTQTLGPFTTDTTGGTGTTYTPTTEGTYYIQTNFPQQKCKYAAAGIPANTTMLASQSEKLALVVTAEPRTFYPDVPLPTEYWTRPINSQFREWGAIAENWLTTPNNRYAPSNDAPEAPHVLWVQPLAEGGVVGGILGANGYEMGDAYEGKFVGQVIINGVLYFNRQIAQNQMTYFNSSTIEQTVVAMDLQTGKIIWEKVLGNNERVSFGQTMYWQTMNMYGGFAYIWTIDGTTWKAYDPLTGRWEWSINNPPSGTRSYGPNGEILVYTVDTTNGWMTQWNSTTVVWRTYYDYYMSRPGVPGQPGGGTANDADVAKYYSERWRPQGIVFNASKGYDWNVTIPKGLQGSANAYFPGDIITGGYINSTGRIVDQPISLWAISLKTGQVGTLLYSKTWQPPTGGLTLAFAARNPDDNVLTVRAKELCAFFGFNMRTGDFLWGPTEPRGYMDMFMGGPSGENGMMANGILYLGTVAGQLQAVDVTNGKILWTYNNTQPYTELMWGGDKWPIEFGFISDGKIYLWHTEHSGNSPLPRGAPFVCLNATTGDVIFRVDGLLRFTVWGGDPMIADSTILSFNTYDNRIYALGKGPSATTLTAPSISVPAGSQVVLSGTVTDVAAGTQEFARTTRFPYGVPAVSDESMGEWMKYVYQQFPRPTTTTGVPVTLSVVDANGNYREIGTTTTSSDGFFSFNWTPDIEGKYNVYASFTGSKSFYPSHAEAAFVIESAASTPAPTAEPVQSTADMYFVPAIAGLFVFVAIIGVVIILVLRKRP